jgi:hypothetical protein
VSGVRFLLGAGGRAGDEHHDECCDGDDRTAVAKAVIAALA